MSDDKKAFTIEVDDSPTGQTGYRYDVIGSSTGLFLLYPVGKGAQSFSNISWSFGLTVLSANNLNCFHRILSVYAYNCIS
jgi:hypothetical protein